MRRRMMRCEKKKGERERFDTDSIRGELLVFLTDIYIYISILRNFERVDGYGICAGRGIKERLKIK